MSSRSNHPGSTPSFDEPVPSTANPSADPSSKYIPTPSDPSPGTTLHGTDNDREVGNVTGILYEEQKEVIPQDESRYAMILDMLSDDVLLEIFDTCRKNHDRFGDIPVWRWHTLAHVCRRWRQIIFGSPRRLDLQILCTHDGTPVRESLDIWPPFPIAIQYDHYMDFPHHDEENLFAALEHHDRICQVFLCLRGPLLEEVATVMQRPFPVLTHLSLAWKDLRLPALPSGFLGGSAPCLQDLRLEGIAFPSLHMLLPSTSDLVNLHLSDIPQEGCISPEAMAVCLAGLARLRSLFIEFQPVTSFPGQSGTPTVTRTLLPALAYFGFRGASEYLEEFLSRIDSPRLHRIHIRYDHQLRDFKVVQLFKYLDRSEDSELASVRCADVDFTRRVTFDMYPHLVSPPAMGQHFEWAHANVIFNCQGIEQKISRIAQVFGQPSSLLSGVVHLKLSLHQTERNRRDDEWLDLFRRCSAIRTLRVSGIFAWHIAFALDNVAAEMVTEVLPVLDLICIDGKPVSCIKKFLTARQLSGNPVTIVETKAEFYERLKAYASKY